MKYKSKELEKMYQNAIFVFSDIAKIAHFRWKKMLMPAKLKEYVMRFIYF